MENFSPLFFPQEIYLGNIFHSRGDKLQEIIKNPIGYVAFIPWKMIFSCGTEFDGDNGQMMQAREVKEKLFGKEKEVIL
jgi:hypothetical protein